MKPFFSWLLQSKDKRHARTASVLAGALICVAIGFVGYRAGAMAQKDKFTAALREQERLAAIAEQERASSASRPIEGPSFAYDFENDPVGTALVGKVPTLLETILSRHRSRAEYSTSDFPLSPERHALFRSQVRDAMLRSLPDAKGWTAVDAEVRDSSVASKFTAKRVATVEVNGLAVEVSTLTIHDTGDVVPVAACFPATLPAPGVIAFSGHSHTPLRELVVDRASYQSGIASRLCEAGFASIAVSKIDSGTMSELFQQKRERWREGRWADDEEEAATTLLGTGDYIIPARQLMANIAALEFFAQDRRVDYRKIGATGVSLGGWLTLQTTLVNPRIKAVANFGGMWSYLEEPTRRMNNLSNFEGINDFSQLFPGIWRLGDQNRFLFAAAPVAMLTGYGRQDAPYTNYVNYFHPKISEQYRVLGRPEALELYVHDGGHILPPEATISFFKQQFGSVLRSAD